jgi:hypothetical protein
MMPRKDDLERYESTQARDIVRLFEAMKPPHEVQAPPDFRVKVLTRLEQQRARRGLLAGLTRVLTPAWVPALAVSLLLSLSVNVWLGFWTLGQREPGDRQAVRPVLGNLDSDVPFDAYTFQAGIQSETELGALATTHSIIGQQAVAFGFAAKSETAKFFIIGALYAEALAYLRSGDLNVAVQRLEAIEKELVELQAPSSLGNYLDKMQELLGSRRYASEALGEFLALFEPLYAEYARSKGADRLMLFRAGTWLENMMLAAAAGDKASLRQANAVQYFRQEMVRLNAPKGVRDALEHMSDLIAKQEITDRDVKEILKLVKKVQLLLG